MAGHLTRRNLLKAGAVAGASAAGPPPRLGDPAQNLSFVNGRIHTMDDRGTVATSLTIRDGRIASVDSLAPAPSPRVINHQLSRQQALHLYTRGNAWYLNREDELGSIEPGKRADLLVLDRDYFSVSDDAMRQTTPVLTVVGGWVVHETGVLR